MVSRKQKSTCLASDVGARRHLFIAAYARTRRRRRPYVSFVSTAAAFHLRLMPILTGTCYCSKSWKNWRVCGRLCARRLHLVSERRSDYDGPALPQCTVTLSTCRLDTRGHFGEEHATERMGTAFGLLKCLRTHYGQHCEPFSGQKALDCMILHTQSQLFRTSAAASRCLDPDSNFRLARQRSHCYCFTKRPLLGTVNFYCFVMYW